jgi:hypothetical protein
MELNEKEVIGADELNKLAQIKDLELLRTKAAELIQSSRTDPRKKASLVNDIKTSRTTDKVLTILWNSLLAGQGLSAVGSRYAKRMKESEKKQLGALLEEIGVDVKGMFTEELFLQENYDARVEREVSDLVKKKK